MLPCIRSVLVPCIPRPKPPAHRPVPSQPSPDAGPFTALPFELVLIVVEHAARASVVDGRSSWIVSACLVCRAINILLNPILHELVCIDTTNIQSICDADAARFRQTRTLVLCYRPLHSDVTAAVVSAFSHVDMLVAPRACFESLCWFCTDFALQPTALRLLYYDHEWPRASPIRDAHSCRFITHLHLSVQDRRLLPDFMRYPVPARVTHVIVDGQHVGGPAYNALWRDMAAFLSVIKVFLKVATLERLLCRSWRIDPSAWAAVTQHLAAVADARIWLDDHDQRHESQLAAARREAALGRSLWMTGHPLQLP